jgi:hypothetical protein
MVKKLGKYNPSSKVGEPENSIIYSWVEEYKIVADLADSQMNTASQGFNEILGSKITSVTDSLDKGIEALDGVDSSISDIKSSVSDAIADNAGTIDEYGKLGVKAVFGVLALIDIAIAAFMLLLCFCSGKCCTKCCCCRCICKLFTHLLWNILALLMIIVFLLGSLLALFGKVGEDMMTIISFLVSDDNLGDDKETILVGEAKDYLGVCINGNGEIEDKLGFNKDDLKSLDDIKDAQNKINYAKNEFKSRLQMVTYTNTIKELEERKNLKSSYFSLLLDDNDNNGDNDNPLNFLALLEIINNGNDAKNIKEKWTLNCDSEHTCIEDADDGISSSHDQMCFHPSKCLPLNRDWISTTTNSGIKDIAQIISDMKSIIDTAYTASTETDGYGNYRYFEESLNDLKDYYYSFLNQYILSLTEFNKEIDRITNKLNKYTGNDAGVFSFINCNFIGKNIKVMLKYLKEAFGGDLYTIGICLILVGCSLALSISSTILLIVVINTDIDNNKKKDNIPENPYNADVRVIQYK